MKPLILRTTAIICLILILYSLFIYYNENYEIKSQVPSTKTILSSYPQGEMIMVLGDVIDVHEDGFILKDTYEGKIVVFKVNSSSPVAITDKVSVLGTLGPTYTIDASKVLIHKKWKEDFILFRSAIAGLILGILFFLYWKFDFKNLEFIRRK